MHFPWLLRLFGLVALLAMNAFFVAAEFSLVTLRQSRVGELLGLGVRGAGAIARLHRRIEDVLSAAQLGETLSALGLGWATAPTLGALFVRALPPATPHAHALLEAVAAGAAFLIVTVLDIVLAELVPKYMAVRHSEPLALVLAAPLEAFVHLTGPMLRAIGGSAEFVLARLGSARGLGEGGAHSAEEIKLLVNTSLRLGELEPFQANIVERVLDLRHAPVRELMTPRPEIQALSVETPLEAAVEFAVRHGRTRLPVTAGSLDHLVGLLDTRDLLLAWQRRRLRTASAGGRESGLRPLLRPLAVVPESKTVGQLLAEFQRGGAPMAAVVDEFGTLTGLITLHDLLQQIVGEIGDDREPASASVPARTGAAPLQVDLAGLTGIRELETLYRMRFPRDDSYETLAGFLLSRLGCLPEGGEQVEMDPYRFTILAMEGHRIAVVRMERAATAPAVTAPSPPAP